MLTSLSPSAHSCLVVVAPQVRSPGETACWQPSGPGLWEGRSLTWVDTLARWLRGSLLGVELQSPLCLLPSEGPEDTGTGAAG